MDKILLIGSEGRIGSRYKAILKYLGIDFDCLDLSLKDRPDLAAFKHWLIATPTDNHYQTCMMAIDRKVNFLCEKPLSKSLDECIKIRDAAMVARINGYVVNNYYCILRPYDNDKSLKLSYNYYNTGNDGLYWDTCQIIYRHRKADIRTTSPIWEFKINDKETPYKDLELSYFKMIEAWVSGDKGWLWDLHCGVEMTQAVIERIKNANDRDTGQK